MKLSIVSGNLLPFGSTTSCSAGTCAISVINWSKLLPFSSSFCRQTPNGSFRVISRLDRNSYGVLFKHTTFDFIAISKECALGMWCVIKDDWCLYSVMQFTMINSHDHVNSYRAKVMAISSLNKSSSDVEGRNTMGSVVILVECWPDTCEISTQFLTANPRK